MEEEKISKRHYKVEVGDIITVKRQDFGEHTFYKVALPKKLYDGTRQYFDKNIAFPKDTNLENGTKIKVLDFFEDVFVRKNDKYNANWTLFITEYEIVESEEDAFENFNNAVDEVEIKDEDVGF